MEIFTALLQLAQAGAVAILVVENGLILVGAFRKWWVPGWLFDREVKRGDTASSAAVANTEALNRLSGSLDTIVEFALRKVGRRG